MRAGLVNRTDLPKGLYIDDLENSSQRNFSSEPKGQSRVLRRPTDAEVQAILTARALLTARGTNTSLTVDTTTNKTLRIKTAAANAYTVITVTSGAATSKARIRDDLNIGFRNAGLNLRAIVVSDHIQIETTVGTAGIIIDTTASGSNLNTAVGFAAGGTVVSPVTLAALRTAAYPTATTIDVSDATILALSASFADLSTAQKDALTDGIADLIAPPLVETSLVLLSFVNGVISKAAAASFRPGGSRGGLTAGPAIAVLANDGVSPFVI